MCKFLKTTRPYKASRSVASFNSSSSRPLRFVVAQSALEIPPIATDNLDLKIENVAYENDTYIISGKLRTQFADPSLVWQVLTDYEALPGIFHNIESSTVKWSDDGGKHLVQSCSWRFLVFRGSFITELAVVEKEAARQLEFSMMKSAFMRKFIGSWDIRPSPCGQGSEISHRLAVRPVVAPPQKIGDLTKKIFVNQVESILGDLAVELHRRSVDLESDSS